MTTEKKQTCDAPIGLDEDEKTARVYFRHIEGTIVFSVSEQASAISKLLTSIISESDDLVGRSEDNPLIFNVAHGTDEIFTFIKNYMEYFDGVAESDPPQKPLPDNTHISAIFRSEYKLFSDIVKENDTLQHKLQTLNKYIMIALYFDIKNLSTKLAAIVANLIQSKSLSQLKNLLGTSPQQTKEDIS
jgi:hypothetical protein